MKLTPIFDTNIFADVQRGLISRQADWSTLLRHRPNRGWPLSSVTALELLAGLDAGKAEGFLDVKQRIARAYNLSNGRVLEDPRVLLCKRILRIPFPDDQLAPAAQLISRYMDVIRVCQLLDQARARAFTTRARRPVERVLTRHLSWPKSWLARRSSGSQLWSGRPTRRTQRGERSNSKPASVCLLRSDGNLSNDLSGNFSVRRSSPLCSIGCTRPLTRPP